MAAPQTVLRELVEAAMVWRTTKATYLALADSKSSPEARVAAARREHLQAVVKLDKAVLAFEQLMAGRKLGKRKNGAPIPWKKMIDGLAVVAGTLSKATDAAAPSMKPIDMSKVIDMPQEK